MPLFSKARAQTMSDEMRLEAAIKSRASLDDEAAIKSRASLDDVSTTSCGNPSTNPSNVQSAHATPRPEDVAPPTNETAIAAKDEHDDSAPLRSCGSRVVMLFFFALSLVDLATRVSLAARVAIVLGAEEAESFWWLLVMQLVACLVGVVFLVARVAAQQTHAGRALQSRLETRQTSTLLVLMMSIAQPELLRCVLPAASHLLTIVRIDTIATLLAGVPFLGLATSYAVEHRFGGALRAAASLANALANVTEAPLAEGGCRGAAGALVEHNATALLSPPPSPPPPPLPPTDPSGDTTVLAIFCASWILLTLLLKLVRLLIASATHAQTGALRKHVAALTEELTAQKAARAEEFAELLSLREYYYGPAGGEAAYDGRSAV